MKTLHFVGEWFDCCAPNRLLGDPKSIQSRCMGYVIHRHLPIRYEHFTGSVGDGVTGAVTGDGIHLMVRTFPQRRAVIADLFVDPSGHAAIEAAMQVLDDLRDVFHPLRALLHHQHRDGQSPVMSRRIPSGPTEVFFAHPARGAV